MYGLPTLFIFLLYRINQTLEEYKTLFNSING